MRLYEADWHEVRDGIKIDWHDDGGIIGHRVESRGSKVAVLARCRISPLIAAQAGAATCDGLFCPPSRLSHADIEERGERWLVPATAETSSEALLLWNGWYHENGDLTEFEVTIDGGGEVLAKETFETTDRRGQVTGGHIVALVRLHADAVAHMSFSRFAKKLMARAFGGTHKRHMEVYTFHRKSDDLLMESTIYGAKYVRR